MGREARAKQREKAYTYLGITTCGRSCAVCRAIAVVFWATIIGLSLFGVGSAIALAMRLS